MNNISKTSKQTDQKVKRTITNNTIKANNINKKRLQHNRQLTTKKKNNSKQQLNIHAKTTTTKT